MTVQPPVLKGFPDNGDGNQQNREAGTKCETRGKQGQTGTDRVVLEVGQK